MNIFKKEIRKQRTDKVPYKLDKKKINHFCNGDIYLKRICTECRKETLERPFLAKNTIEPDIKRQFIKVWNKIRQLEKGAE
jgi:hypothetical protein